MRVIIAGAGIGGLVKALMLHARGIDCEVFEQADAVRELRRPLLLTTVGCKVLVRESAIRKWFNNFDLGLTKANMASITSGSELTVISIKSARILRLDGLIQRFQI